MKIQDYIRRNGGSMVPPGSAVKVSRLKLNRGGYDRRGNYFGVGDPSYVMEFEWARIPDGRGAWGVCAVGIRWTRGYQALRTELRNAGFKVGR